MEIRLHIWVDSLATREKKHILFQSLPILSLKLFFLYHDFSELKLSAA